MCSGQVFVCSWYNFSCCSTILPWRVDLNSASSLTPVASWSVKRNQSKFQFWYKLPAYCMSFSFSAEFLILCNWQKYKSKCLKRDKKFSLRMSLYSHTSYLSFLLHKQNFWRIKFTPKKRVNYDKIHSKLQFFALLRQNTQ